jgi:hypothetical protein
MQTNYRKPTWASTERKEHEVVGQSGELYFNQFYSRPVWNVRYPSMHTAWISLGHKPGYLPKTM